MTQNWSAMAIIVHKPCKQIQKLWWRHGLETLPVLLTLCEGNSPKMRPVMRSYEMYFVVVGKLLNKQSTVGDWDPPSAYMTSP